MSRDKFSYTHGSTGTEPASSLNFAANERPKSDHFDWWWYSVLAAINGHADEFTRLDSDDDGIVDEADDADTVDGKHYTDIQSWVNNSADVTYHGGKTITDLDNRYYRPANNEKFRMEVRTSDPSTLDADDDGRMWMIE